ncbi:TGB1 [Rose virus C]|nr:triple gene block 1 [Rose virus C]UVJ49774.1 TGB1 [Rose virus C]
MDVLLSVLARSNFIESNRFESKPFVFHCVPGAGKSTLIRELLSLDERFVAITFGKPDHPNLSGRFIQSSGVDKKVLEGKLVLIDEYNCGPYWEFKAFAVFGDPLQKVSKTLRANYINFETKRFGQSTCALLNSLGFEVTSNKEDVVEIAEIIGGEPEGLVVAVESEAVDIVRDSGYECYCIEELRGITAEVVTFVAASNKPPPELREEIFVALTRHRSKLLILAPDAYYGPTKL